MRKVLKWISIVIGVLLGLVLIFTVGMYASGTSRLNRTYPVEPAPVSFHNDDMALARGEYIYNTTCIGCHGPDLAGKAILDDPALGYFPASNLTRGDGGIDHYTDLDLMRAIRHGVGADGKPLMIMPSKAYWYFSDQDLNALVAYLNAAPALDNNLGEKNAKPLARILLALGVFGDIFAAEVIDHDGPRPSVPEHDVTVEYGEYLVNTSDCRSCHGPDLAGAQSSEPGAPFSPNLTPGGVLAIWTTEDFIETIRTGTSPYGRQLDSNFMPWKEYSNFTDDDLTAIFMYLESLPTMETTQ
jgi:mono/diheme cytochrome c family protein